MAKGKKDQDILGKDEEQLQKEVLALELEIGKELLSLKMRRSKNTNIVSNYRKRMARIKTLLRQKQTAASNK